MAIYYKNTLDRVFHALGDNTRREMLAILAKKNRVSANQLAQSFDVSQPTVSKHIKVLEKSNLVIRNIQGRTHYFSLNETTLSNAEQWINRHRNFWLGSLNQLDSFIQSLDDDDE